MTRWHQKACQDPDVVVQDGIPRCRACESSPDLDALIQACASTSIFEPLPPDEPPGQLNLHWPYPGLYTSTSPSDSGDAGVKDQHDPNEPEEPPSPTPVYPSRLALDEFRLLYLYESEHHGLIHAELNVHTMNRCPEYETTSYTWGGEDGDNTLCKPIFLGAYWDVLIQTRNCWSMLASMRLPRGFRVIWVDAICINQKDPNERRAQVAAMAQIYSQCRRVCVYLGPDIVPDTATQYPLRQQFKVREKPNKYTEADPDPKQVDDTVDLEELLKKRYFSRVWIVQELILAREAAIRVGDTEYWATPSIFKALREATMPWLEHLGAQRLMDGYLYNVLRAVRASQCGDPRDRLFGIWALLEDESRVEGALKPNYRLSSQHVFIGLFAFMLFRQKELSILSHATGRDAWDRFPSWLPDWNNSSPRWIFQREHGTDFYPRENRWMRETLDQVKTRYLKPSLQGEARPGWMWKHRPPTWEIRNNLESRSRWYRNATINAATGTLSINLLRLLTLQVRPTPLPNKYGLDLSVVKNGSVAMVMHANDPLSEIVEPGCDHIFVLETYDESMLLLLRQAETPGTYRLVTHLRGIVFQSPFIEKDRATEENKAEMLHFSHLRNPLAYLLHGSRIWDPLNEQDRDWPYFVALILDYGRPTFQSDNPHDFGRSTLLEAVQGALNEARGSCPGFLDSFINCLHDSLEPRIQDDFVCVKLDTSEWTSRQNQVGDLSELQALWQPIGLARQDTKTQIRAHKGSLIRAIEDTDAFHNLSKLKYAVQETNETEYEMSRRYTGGPEPDRYDEDSLVRCASWPVEIMDAFNIDGGAEVVNII